MSMNGGLSKTLITVLSTALIAVLGAYAVAHAAFFRHAVDRQEVKAIVHDCSPYAADRNAILAALEDAKEERRELKKLIIDSLLRMQPAAAAGRKPVGD